MNVLMIAPYVPSRIRVRTFHIVTELAKRHSVTVVALGETDGPKVLGAEELLDSVANLVVVPHSKIRGLRQSLCALPTAVPMCAAFCRSTAMGRAVDEVMAQDRFDIVHVEHLRAAHFAPFDRGVPVVFDSVDCLTDLFSQMARSGRNPLGKLVAMEEAWKLRRYEPRMLRRFGRVMITSESEREALLRLDGTLDVETVPNGVDTDYFAPQGTVRAAKRIVFSGKMSYSPNAGAAAWFAENAFPLVREKHPEAEFVIAGSAPGPRVQKLAEVPGITVTGYVDDLRPVLDAASVAVAPMRTAVGIQNKVLEAMAMGLPVVASPLATRAIGDGVTGLIEAESPRDTADAVVDLLGSPERAAALGRGARDVVVNRFSWRSSVEAIDRIYGEVLGRRPE